MGNSVTAIPFLLASSQRRSSVAQLTFITATENKRLRKWSDPGDIFPRESKCISADSATCPEHFELMPLSFVLLNSYFKNYIYQN